MSARMAEVERWLQLCIHEIEELRFQRLAHFDGWSPGIRTSRRIYTPSQDWGRQAKFDLLRRRTKALEAVFTALWIQKASAELDGHIEREIDRAEHETDSPSRSDIARSACEAVSVRLDEAMLDARRELRKVRLRFMTTEQKAAHERRQKARRRRHMHGHEL